MIRLAHLSDLHIAPLPPVPPLQLMGKRMTGYLNWRMKRGIRLGEDVLAQITDHLRASRPDLTAVTGDLVNLGLDAEFRQSRAWLKRIGPSKSVSVVPGNHDAYVRGAREKALTAWGRYATGHRLDENPFPFIKHSQFVAMVGCSSAVATPPFIAAGHFDKGQAERLETILKSLGDAGIFRVVLIHHGPQEELTSRRRGLWGASRFRDVIARVGAELVLHGHEHESIVSAIRGPELDVPVVGVASASSVPGGHHPPARYNLFEIDRAGKGFTCTMVEYGFRRLGDEIVERMRFRLS